MYQGALRDDVQQPLEPVGSRLRGRALARPARISSCHVSSRSQRERAFRDSSHPARGARRISLLRAASHDFALEATSPSSLRPSMLSSTTDRPTWHGALQSLLRIVTGALFMQHGVQKLFGLLLNPTRPWNGPPEFLTQFWFAGVLETFGGALIVLGLFTRPVAFLLAGEMAVAYFQAHFPRNFWPIRNGGEVVVMFCFTYLYLFAVGGGPFSLDALLGRWRSARNTDVVAA